MTPAAALLLSLVGPAAPAAKADTGVPTELIDLLPEDTAGVMVVDAPKVTKSEIGQAIAKLFLAQQRPDQLLEFADLAREARWVVLGQFLVDKAVGDFCLIVRLREKSEYANATIAKFKRDKKDFEQIGTRTVYSPAGQANLAVAKIDDRTMLVMAAAGDTAEQVKQTRAAAFGNREQPGPSRALRKLIAEGVKDDRAIQLYAHHPTKVAQSAYLPLANFGVKQEAVFELGDKLVSYRGGIRMGEAGEVELRFTAKDADAARELMKAYEVVDNRLKPFLEEFRASAKVVREGEEVILTARLTKATLELVGEKKNK
jgi:hypothetical protein